MEGDEDPRGRCQPDPGGTLNYTVDLIEVSGLRGTFEFDGAVAASATLDSKGLVVTGNEAVVMKRAGDDEDCMGNDDADVNDACTVWTDVFNLCGPLGDWNGSSPDDMSGPTLLNQFTVEPGNWSVSKGGGRRSIRFGFAIPPAQSEGTDRDLSAGLTLSSECKEPVNDPSCEGDELIPTEAGAINAVEFVVDQARVHLRGHAGVTHKAFCHADTDSLVINGSTLGSTLVITLKAAE